MSRCHQTDALLDATFAGSDLTRQQAAHVAHCAECARALSDTRRFDAALARVGLDLSPALAPSATEVLAADGSHTKEGRLMMTVRRGLISSVAGAVVIGSILIGARWLSGEGPPAGIGSGPPAVALSGPLEDWLHDAEVATAASTGEILVGDASRLVRAEECGRDFTVVLQNDEGRDFYWVSGPKEDGREATGGRSRSVFAAEVARDRAADGALCERIVEATISRADAAAAVERMGGIPSDARVEAASLLEPGTAMVVMEGSLNFWSDEQWWVGPLHRSANGWSGKAEEWIGTNLPDESGGLKYIPADAIAGRWPDRSVLAVVLPDPPITAAVELDIDGVPHRYPANAGESTLIIALPDAIEGPIAVRYIGPDGEAFGEHVVEP